jgi:hypothetical protein
MDQDLRSRIKAAAQERGLDPEIAVNFAKAESSLDPNAKAKTSSARGLFQVIDRTWKEYGGGDKKDINEQIRVGTDVIASNQASFKRKFNREPSAAELYAYHVLGPTGAPPLLRADPATPMEQIVSREAIKANPMWRGKTAGDVLGTYEKKVGGSQQTRVATQQTKPGMRPTNYSFEPLTQLDIENLGPGYQAGMAAMALADTQDNDEDNIAERAQEAKDDAENSMLADSGSRNVANLEFSYASPFPQEAPVQMAEGGEARKMMDAVYRAEGSPEEGEKGMLRKMYEGAVPAQARTFLETAIMSPEERAKRPITEKDFSEQEQRQMLESVVNARKKRAQTLGLTEPVDPEIRKQKDDEFIKSFGVLKGQGKKDIENIVKNANESRRKQEEYFLSGSGHVHYYDYPNAHSLGDSTLGGNAAIRNTLGRFTYQTTPQGQIKIKDRYDFKDDLAGVDGQRPSADYEKMSAAEKLKTLFMDTVDNPRDRLQKENRSIFTMKQGLDTLPSRVGSAFIGSQGRPVEITVDPRQLMPGVSGYAYGGPVYRADGSPEYGEISMGDFSGDTRQQLRDAITKRGRATTKEDLRLLGQIPVQAASNMESFTRGSLAAIPGAVGDIESVFTNPRADSQSFPTRSGVEARKQTVFPTTERILESVPRVTPANERSAGFEDIGTYDMGIAAAPIGKVLAKGAKVAAPIVAESLATSMAKKGERAAPSLLQMIPDVSQPFNIVTPSGRVFLSNMKMGEAPLSRLDAALNDVQKYASIDPEKQEGVMKFMDTKFRDYVKNRAGTVNDDMREALLEGRIKIPKDTPLEENYPQALIDAARKGDITALRQLEFKLHGEMGIEPKLIAKTDNSYDEQTLARQENVRAILEQMKENPNVIPDAMLLRLIGKDITTMPTKEAAEKVAEMKEKLQKNPTLFNTIFEDKLLRIIKSNELDVVDAKTVQEYPNNYPALTSAPSKQEGIMALSQNAPIADVDSYPTLFGMDLTTIANAAQHIPEKDLERMSAPEVVNFALKYIQDSDQIRSFAKKAENLASAGKEVPVEIATFGTKQIMPADTQGFMWREITNPDAVNIQAAIMKNSIGSYASPGTYGALGKGRPALEKGEVRIFGLYDPKSQLVANAEYVTDKAKEKVGVLQQVKGNGPRTGGLDDTVKYPTQVETLINYLNPTQIPPGIKQMLDDNGIFFTK